MKRSPPSLLDHRRCRNRARCLLERRQFERRPDRADPNCRNVTHQHYIDRGAIECACERLDDNLHRFGHKRCAHLNVDNDKWAADHSDPTGRPGDRPERSKQPAHQPARAPTNHRRLRRRDQRRTHHLLAVATRPDQHRAHGRTHQRRNVEVGISAVMVLVEGEWLLDDGGLEPRACE